MRKIFTHVRKSFILCTTKPLLTSTVVYGEIFRLNVLFPSKVKILPLVVRVVPDFGRLGCPWLRLSGLSPTLVVRVVPNLGCRDSSPTLVVRVVPDLGRPVGSQLLSTRLSPTLRSDGLGGHGGWAISNCKHFYVWENACCSCFSCATPPDKVSISPNQQKHKNLADTTKECVRKIFTHVRKSFIL